MILSRLHIIVAMSTPVATMALGGGSLVRRSPRESLIIDLSTPDDKARVEESKTPPLSPQGYRSRRPSWPLLAFGVLCLCMACKLYYDSTLDEFRKRPMMVQLLTGHNVTKLSLQDTPNHFIRHRQNHYWVDHGVVDRMDDDKSKLQEGCVPLGKWQDDIHSTCLVFHEMEMNDDYAGETTNTRLVAHGAYRDVWRLLDYNGTALALKTLRYSKDRDFDRWMESKHRQDAVAMEQLSKSPHILNIHGSCSNSAIVEYTEDGDLHGIFEKRPTKEELIKIAHNVASAVADAHHVDYKGRATIAHADIKPDQFLLIHGRYKLNDFNRAKFLSWDMERQEHCGFVFEYKNEPVRVLCSCSFHMRVSLCEI